MKPWASSGTSSTVGFRHAAIRFAVGMCSARSHTAPDSPYGNCQIRDAGGFLVFVLRCSLLFRGLCVHAKRPIRDYIPSQKIFGSLQQPSRNFAPQ